MDINGESIYSDYKRAGFGGRLSFGERPALIVVDMARAYLDPDGPLFHPSYLELAERVARAIVFFRNMSLPVFFTKVLYQKGLADGGLFVKKVPSLAAFEEGSYYCEIPEPLTPLEGEVVITKRYASGFFGTNLATDLHIYKVDTVVVAGVSVSGCVRATALDALQYGFIPYVAEDLAGDRSQDIMAANLFDLSQKYAEVVPFSDIASQVQLILRNK
jgi:maleamate amidohydrolase